MTTSAPHKHYKRIDAILTKLYQDETERDDFNQKYLVKLRNLSELNETVGGPVYVNGLTEIQVERIERADSFEEPEILVMGKTWVLLPGMDALTDFADYIEEREDLEIDSAMEMAHWAGDGNDEPKERFIINSVRKSIKTLTRKLRRIHKDMNVDHDKYQGKLKFIIRERTKSGAEMIKSVAAKSAEEALEDWAFSQGVKHRGIKVLAHTTILEGTKFYTSNEGEQI